ncbi:MAG: TonB-dependent receptor [Ideonella sp. MAG2]|nr:MAG: TonB-dependent receptor [Ideonella sp. MAG2]
MFKRTVLSASLVAAFTSGMLASASAQAQTADAKAERVEVTGSRIKRIDSETSQPIFTMNREAIQAQGLPTIGDVLQNLSANGSALNSTYNNGGNGETRVSLRNLGSNRTLVLVNGRRWVGGTGLGGAVDLNTIPSAAVDRIEVLKDGASVTYGSDAIAGVVNVILRNDFNGAEVNVYTGQYDKGDGQKNSFDLTIGSSGEKFRSMVGIGYVKEDPVGAGDRHISSEPIIGTGTAFGSSTTPFGRFAICNGTWNSSLGTCSGTQTRPDGSAGQFTYDPNKSGTNWRNFRTAPVGDLPDDFYNFAPDNYLVTPQERISLFGRASYDLTPDTQIQLQAIYNQRKSEQLLASMPIVLGTGPGAGTQSKLISISKDSIYNPFGADVSRIQRRAVETGGRSFKQDVNTLAVSGGLEGNVDIGGKAFSWNAGAMYARNSQSDVTTGLFNVAALKNALGPSMLDSAGKPICVSKPGDASSVITGCVPMNLLGAPGSITPEMLAYSGFVAHDTLGYTMRHLYANITGDLFKLPAGALGFAAGVEKRNESGFDSPDALIASGNTTGNARTPTIGGYGVTEGYVELSVPLLKNLPAVKALDLSLAVRHSDYTNFGSTTNSKAGVTWKLNNDLMLRGNWSQGFRAPAIDELYQGLADSFPQVADPCSTTFGGGYNSLNDQQKARCHAQGVPVGGYDQGNPQIRISTGGNPFLKPETSVTKTLGFVASPSFLPGVDLTFDWWSIALKNGIQSFTGQTILDRCIEQGDANACQLFNRSPGGQINTLISAGLNFKTIDVEGYDLTLSYRLPKSSLGTFGVVWDTTYMKKYSENGEENQVGHYYDRDNYWRVRSNLNVNWQRGDFGANWGIRYFSSQVEDCDFGDPEGFDLLCSDPVNLKNKLGATTYHDVSVNWKAPWKAKFTFGINNIFNRQPPTSYSTFANSFDPQYEIPGRFLYVRYTQSF